LLLPGRYDTTRLFLFTCTDTVDHLGLQRRYADLTHHDIVDRNDNHHRRIAGIH